MGSDPGFISRIERIDDRVSYWLDHRDQIRSSPDHMLADLEAAVAELHRAHEMLAAKDDELIAAKTLSEQDRREALELRNRLTEERVKRTRAEEAVRGKDQILALVYHELRNPLTPVLMALEGLMANRGQLPPELRDTLEMMQRNILTERRLVDDLLDLTRIAHGKLELILEDVPLHRIVDEVAAGARSALTHKQLTLYIEKAEGEPMVRGDPVRLQQILWNLLHNAAKFTHAGGRIYLRTIAPLHGEHVILEVQDTGAGIRHEDLQRIFRPFEQSSGAQQHGGLGLGLSIVRSLVVSHGGTVEALSNGPGTGALFRVTLPRLKEATRAVLPAVTQPHAQGPLDICIVEDHADTAAALAKLLAAHGHRAVCCGNIARTVKLLRHHFFDLLLIDLGLPDGKGHEILSRVRREQFGRAVAVSGTFDPETEATCKSAGFERLLAKPIVMDDLLDVLAARQQT